jgi:hypothetical protein
MGSGRSYGSAKRVTMAREESLGESFFSFQWSILTLPTASSRPCISERVTSLAEGGWSENGAIYLTLFSLNIYPHRVEIYDSQ